MGTRLGTVLGTTLGTVLGTSLGGGGSAPSEWPLQMAAVYPTMGWWDPADPAVGSVDTWLDKINAYSITSSGTNRPVKSGTTIDGKPGVAFTRANLSRMTGADALAALLSGTAPYTIMVMAKPTYSTNGLGVAVSAGANAGGGSGQLFVYFDQASAT